METIQFLVDTEKHEAAVEVMRRYSPRQKVFTLLITLAVIWLVVSVFVFNRGFSPETQKTVRVFLVGVMVAVFAGIPLLVLISLRMGLVDGTIRARRNELMLLSEVGLEYSFCYNSYNPTLEMSTEEYSFNAIAYRDITRIELYEDVQAIKVFGKVHICSQPGTPTEQNTLRIIDDPDKAYRVFFLYYHDADKLVQLLSERSGQPVIRLPQCTGTLQEKN